jgi:hypothetical protein
MGIGAGSKFGRVISLALALQFGAGCSMALIQRAPPAEKRRACFYCTQEMVLPAADGLVAAVGYANMTYALTKSDADYRGETLSQTSDIVISGLLATIFTISAAVGHGWVVACRAASEATAVPAAAVRNPLGPFKAPIAPPAADEPIVAPVEPDPPGDDTPSAK